MSHPAEVRCTLSPHCHIFRTLFSPRTDWLIYISAQLGALAVESCSSTMKALPWSCLSLTVGCDILWKVLPGEAAPCFIFVGCWSEHQKTLRLIFTSESVHRFLSHVAIPTRSTVRTTFKVKLDFTLRERMPLRSSFMTFHPFRMSPVI